MKIYIIDWADKEYTDHQTLVLANNRQEANDVFDRKHGKDVYELGEWSCSNIPRSNSPKTVEIS